jgi:hypothetical protein
LETQKKRLKAISGSSPFFAFSNYTTFSRIQTGATVPLNSSEYRADRTEYFEENLSEILK